jgi:hypothetical protein
MVVEPGTRGGKMDVVWWIGIYFNRKLIFNYHIHTRVVVAARAFSIL